MRPFAKLMLLLLPVVVWATTTAAQPQGQVTYAMHVTIVPAWFDPAENTGIATPFMVQEAIHDAVAKPMPQHGMAPSLAESWTESPDGLAYEFVLRRGVVFHNGEPVTAEDVKFSFERYRGSGAKILYMLNFGNGVGPRIQESSLGRIPLHYYTAPFEDIRLKDQ